MRRRTAFEGGLVLWAGLLLAACTAVHYQAAHLQDHVGTATQADILSFFGEPHAVTTRGDGHQVWVYRFTQTVVGGTAIVGRRVCWETVLAFDEKGMLRAQERRACEQAGRAGNARRP